MMKQIVSLALFLILFTPIFGEITSSTISNPYTGDLVEYHTDSGQIYLWGYNDYFTEQEFLDGDHISWLMNILAIEYGYLSISGGSFGNSISRMDYVFGSSILNPKRNSELFHGIGDSPSMQSTFSVLPEIDFISNSEGSVNNLNGSLGILFTDINKNILLERSIRPWIYISSERNYELGVDFYSQKTRQRSSSFYNGFGFDVSLDYGSNNFMEEQVRTNPGPEAFFLEILGNVSLSMGLNWSFDFLLKDLLLSFGIGLYSDFGMPGSHSLIWRNDMVGGVAVTKSISEKISFFASISESVSLFWYDILQGRIPYIVYNSSFENQDEDITTFVGNTLFSTQFNGKVLVEVTDNENLEIGFNYLIPGYSSSSKINWNETSFGVSVKHRYSF